VFTNKKREGINSFVCAVSLCVAEKLKTLTKDHEPSLSIMPFSIVAYGFVGQPFWKQVYACYAGFVKSCMRPIAYELLCLVVLCLVCKCN